jgi:hypothetical protein
MDRISAGMREELKKRETEKRLFNIACESEDCEQPITNN